MKVRDVGVDVGEVLLTARAPQRAGGSVVLRELEQVAVMALADGLLVASRREALGRVRADRFKHPESRWRLRVLATHEQALGHQLVQRRGRYR